MLRSLGFTAIPLNGQMSQNKRLASLNKFKSKSRTILLATDVASRGLDIPHVDVVLNSFIIFCSTCSTTLRLSLLLRNLGFTAIPLNGQMNQNKRLASLNKFKSKSRTILLA